MRSTASVMAARSWRWTAGAVRRPQAGRRVRIVRKLDDGAGEHVRVAVLDENAVAVVGHQARGPAGVRREAGHPDQLGLAEAVRAVLDVGDADVEVAGQHLVRQHVVVEGPEEADPWGTLGAERALEELHERVARGQPRDLQR